MSSHESIIKTIKNDLSKTATAYADRIINSPLAHVEYTVAQTMYRALTDVVAHINTALSFIKANPDSAIPETFLDTAVGTPDPEVNPEAAAPTATTVDIASGTIIQGTSDSFVGG